MINRPMHTIIFMLLISAVFAALLAGANAYYSPVIRENEEEVRKKSVLYVLDVAVNESARLQEVYEENIIETNLNGTKAYAKLSPEGEAEGYAFFFSAPGLWGTINGYIAVARDFRSLLGVDFVSHNETPGLGGRIDELWFKEQFRKISIGNNAVLAYKNEDGGQVDAITGATSTSRAVLDILNSFIVQKIPAVEVVK